LLAAHGRAWRFGMTGPLVSADGIREILQVPPPWHIAALVPIGYPDEEPWRDGPQERRSCHPMGSMSDARYEEVSDAEKDDRREPCVVKLREADLNFVTGLDFSSPT
jgi:hypothetical protein